MDKAQFQDKVFAMLKRSVSEFSIEKSDEVDCIDLVDTADANEFSGFQWQRQTGRSISEH